MSDMAKVGAAAALTSLIFICSWITIAIVFAETAPPPGPNIDQRAASACEKAGGVPDVQDVVIGHYEDINGYSQPTVGTRVTCEAKP